MTAEVDKVAATNRLGPCPLKGGGLMREYVHTLHFHSRKNVQNVLPSSFSSCPALIWALIPLYQYEGSGCRKGAGYALAICSIWRPLPYLSSIGGAETIEHTSNGDEMFAGNCTEGAMGTTTVAIGGCSCVCILSHSMAPFDILMTIRLEQAAEDPSALTQETIIEKLDPVEAARLDKVRNIGIAVCVTCTCAPEIELRLAGTYRQWQDHRDRTRSLLHRPNQLDTRSSWQRCCRRKDGLHGFGERKGYHYPVCGDVLRLG